MSEGKKLTKLEITDYSIFNYKIQPFVSNTKEYGNAEFIMCPVWRRGKIREVYMYPKQQPNAEHYYYLVNEDGWEGVNFGSLLYELVGEVGDGKGGVLTLGKNVIHSPNVWNTFWCKEHKCQAFEFYVPKNSKGFFISTGLGKFCIEWR